MLVESVVDGESGTSNEEVGLSTSNQPGACGDAVRPPAGLCRSYDRFWVGVADTGVGLRSALFNGGVFELGRKPEGGGGGAGGTCGANSAVGAKCAVGAAGAKVADGPRGAVDGGGPKVRPLSVKFT